MAALSSAPSASSSKSVRTDTSSGLNASSHHSSSSKREHTHTVRCGSSSLLCLNGVTSKLSPLVEKIRIARESKWCRIHHHDGYLDGEGRKNRFDGSEWMKLRQNHFYEYEEWAQAQECKRHGCFERKAGLVFGGKQVEWCVNHFGRNQLSKNTCGSVKNDAPARGSVSSNGSRVSDNVDDKTKTSAIFKHNDGHDQSAPDKSALDRVMNLQKRVLNHEPPILNTKCGPDMNNGSLCSSASNHSRRTMLKRHEEQPTTRIDPEKRRQSDGNVRLGQERKRSVIDRNVLSDRRGNAPKELIKTTIKPMNLPMGMHLAPSIIPTATEKELLANRLEEMEERKDPDRTWAKMGKYVTFALRGFGMFNVSLGRGLYGAELQKSLRRRSTDLKHQLWEDKIRVPLNNRIVNGMALNSWGADDGCKGQKDAILLNDCFPLDSLNFDRFKLIDEKVEEHSKPPQTIYMFTKMDRQQSRLFASIDGEEHLQERLIAIDQLGEIHEERPDYPNASFVAEVWERVMYQYVSCVAEGVHFIVSQHDDGVTFGKIKKICTKPWRGRRNGLAIHPGVRHGFP